MGGRGLTQRHRSRLARSEEAQHAAGRVHLRRRFGFVDEVVRQLAHLAPRLRPPALSRNSRQHVTTWPAARHPSRAPLLHPHLLRTAYPLVHQRWHPPSTGRCQVVVRRADFTRRAAGLGLGSSRQGASVHAGRHPHRPTYPVVSSQSPGPPGSRVSVSPAPAPTVECMS